MEYWPPPKYDPVLESAVPLIIYPGETGCHACFCLDGYTLVTLLAVVYAVYAQVVMTHPTHRSFIC